MSKTYTTAEAMKELGISTRATLQRRSLVAQIKPKKVPFGRTQATFNGYTEQDIALMKALEDPRQVGRKKKKKEAAR